MPSAAIEELNDKGIVPQINSGYRIPGEPVQGGGPVQAPPFHSRHNASEAVDILGADNSPEIVSVMSGDFCLRWGMTFLLVPDRKVHFDNLNSIPFQPGSNSDALAQQIYNILPYALNCTTAGGQLH
jgi:hypothetical protein